MIDADTDEGTIELAFDARNEWANPVGNVLGAFVAAMLYDAVGPALLATLEPDQFQATHGLNVQFLRPLRPGRAIARARIVRRDGDIVQLEASLSDAGRETVATATATAEVIRLEQARDAV